MEPSPSYEHPTSSSASEATVVSHSSYSLRSYKQNTEIETLPVSDEDSIQIILRSHDQFLNSMQSRLTKLQVVQRLWERNDVKGVISALDRMSDHGVSADVLCSLKDKSDVITLDICTSLLPLLTNLLESKRDRHLGVALEMLLKLVRIFGPVIHSTMSAGPSVGVDLQAEQRLERCNLCFIELEKVKHSISSLMRRGGSIAKDARELNLALQEVL
ncbi:katanin p80 WD40 repeat-containing subunit B1 homolog KTN80.4-like [Curcuma longa]|uniref:katanin p80 WD40 repeat-containing subunit B1 homolog KTN80.4-like n=1 Tax=Curcuma longa TaxID=136217 RepID=UPI003D9E210A